MYANIVVDTEAASYLDSFTYEVPEGLRERIEVGASVLVPFGKTQAIGYVVGTEETPSVEKTKPILAVIDSPIKLSPQLVEVAGWLSERYICGLSRCTSSILPGVLQCKVQTLIDLTGEGDSPVLSALSAAGGSLPLETVRADCPDQVKNLAKLEKAGAIARRYELVLPEGKTKTVSAVSLAVTPEEALAEAGSLAKRAPKQAEVLLYLADHGPTPCSSAGPAGATFLAT